MKMRSDFGLGILICACSLIFSAPASALFHIVDFSEVFSNADGTIQFIEMRMTSDFENLLAGHLVTSNANTFTIPSNLSSTITNGKTWLMATSGFAALPGSVPPDFIIPNNFFSIDGDTLTLVGGLNPPMTFAQGVLPTDGVMSINKAGAAATNSPENFNGDIGQISVPSNGLDNVYVYFEAGSNGAGTQGSPFDNLADAISAANEGAIIHLESGASIETFSGGSAITKALTLQNDSPGNGSAVIGGSAARRSSKSGFRTREALP